MFSESDIFLPKTVECIAPTDRRFKHFAPFGWQDKIWVIFYTITSPLCPDRQGAEVCLSLAHATITVEEMEKGEFAKNHATAPRIAYEIEDSGVFQAIPHEHNLPERVLSSAGISFGSYASNEICECLGSDLVERLKKAHGAKWVAAGVLYYCDQKFHKSSPEYLAALCMYHKAISQDAFSEGYYRSKLESSEHGVLEKAMAKDSIVRAARAGGAARAKAAEAARKPVLAEIRRLISEGMKPAKAAREAHRNGFGHSEDGNVKMWNRDKSRT